MPEQEKPEGQRANQQEKREEEQVKRRSRRARDEGKAPSTQAGEFVREEIDHVRQGKHGARSTKQAIAIGLSKARRAGVKLPPPKRGATSEKTRKSAERAYELGQGAAPRRPPSARRSRATRAVLKREGHAAGSHKAVSQQARRASARRGPALRSAAAKKASRTKGPARRKAAAQKAARSRRAHRSGKRS
jgi:hypothetical protein